MATKPLHPDTPALGLLIAEPEMEPGNEALEAEQNCPVCKHHDRKDDFN